MIFQFKLRNKTDLSIPVLGLALSLFGLVMVLSSSQIVAADKFDGNQYYFFSRQLVWFLIGGGAFFFFNKISLEKLYGWRSWFLIASIVMLVVLFIPGVGSTTLGSQRWINLGFTKFQPSEAVKFFMIIYFASWFAGKGHCLSDLKKTWLPFMAILTVVGGLIIAQPDMGTMMILLIVSMSIYLVSGAKMTQVLSVIGIGLIAAGLLAVSSPYRMKRVTTFLNQSSLVQDSLGDSYHNYQALLAIGSGGMWGVGFGQSLSKYSYLPHSYNDSIFAVISEELGFVRTALFLLVYLVFVWRGFLVAKNANSEFVRMLAVGITVLFFAQALINIGGMLHIIPMTGVPLPFVSYGGTSLLFCMAALGLLTNISRETARQ